MRWLTPARRVRLAIASLAIATTVVASSAQDPKKKSDPESTTEPASRGEQGWWMDRHKEHLARVKPGKTDLIFVGDSITQGWEGGGADVWARYYGPRKAVNLGIGGDRTQHVLWRLDHDEVKGIHPKAAVVMIGTNNVHSNSPDQIVEGITAIVKKLHEKLPETKILLLGVFPRSQKPDDARARIKAINAKVQALDDGGKTVKFLDISQAFLNPDGTISKEIMPDYLHLSPKGYRIWAESIEPTLWTLMEGSK